MIRLQLSSLSSYRASVSQLNGLFKVYERGADGHLVTGHIEIGIFPHVILLIGFTSTLADK